MHAAGIFFVAFIVCAWSFALKSVFCRQERPQTASTAMRLNRPKSKNEAQGRGMPRLSSRPQLDK